jgi:hypothetical protein
MKQILLCVTLLACAPFAGMGADNGWVDLFNGKDLKGWTQHGGKAKYEVKDGVIVGSTVLNTPNSFLCTDKTYGAFVLELDFRVDPGLNSGVQVRSEVFDEAKELEVGGKTIKVPAGRVHGYQVEIDMDSQRKRWWVAGIYDEARRGWLYPGPLGGNGAEFTEQGAKVARPNDWNKLRVEAKGDSIKTFLNGQPRADIKDNMTPRGIIALQVHGVGKDAQKEGITVEWRNIRIKAEK